MIVVGGSCDLRMTLFHHLKLKRPRIDSSDSAAPAMAEHRGTNGREEVRRDPPDRDTTCVKDRGPFKGDGQEDPPNLECSSHTSSDDNDTSAMPRLERQNSVFDGGGVHNNEGRDVLPHLSPQLWPPSNTLAYHRHFGPASEEDPEEPPPLLMGDVQGRGKTMVWTRSPALPSRGRVPPTSTITSPTTPKRTPSPKATSTSPSATQHFETTPLVSLFRPQGNAMPDTQALNLCVASTSRGDSPGRDDDQQMVCMICEDRATGLHYGIITCEGCKGFFKRTVQNKRVYTCVAEGNCEVTKAQRNRCQYCRFQKCVRQGMVLAAVREDRMPGGRNSGAVYNLYKVKYKKHRRGQKNGHVVVRNPEAPPLAPPPRLSGGDWSNGQILKTALTSPADVVHLRPRPDANCSTVSSSRGGVSVGVPLGGTERMSTEQAATMIRELVECEAFEEVARLKNAQELLRRKMALNDKLCHIGDSIVYKLVQWTKRLPFYHELPVAVHTQLLTRKWHELLVLTTCAFQAIRGSPPGDVNQAVGSALRSLRECLAIMVGVPVGLDELREAGPLVEKLALLADSFRRMNLCLEEYVCLKVVIMQSPDEIKDQKELEDIHERYLSALRVFVEQRFPQQTTRFADLLSCIPEIQAAASLVVQSKMFYVPLLLNTSLSK